MNKPSQFVFLPTDKASRIVLKDKTKTLILYDTYRSVPHSDGFAQQYLYILSNDKIKEGDSVIWYGKNNQPFLKKALGERIFANENEFLCSGSYDIWIEESKLRKIIATTNPELLYNEILHARIGTDKYRYVNKISQSHIEYIISLYNGKGKGKEVDAMEAHARNFSGLMNAVDMEDEKYYNSHTVKIYEAFIQGWKTNQYLQDNADKKFTLDDIREAYFTCSHNPQSLKEQAERELNNFLKKLSKEQPKSDTVMVIYKKEISKEIYTPVIQDGCIVIARN